MQVLKMPRDLDPKFRVYYVGPDGDAVNQGFQTKQLADEFAKGLELMGVTDITKHFYNPKIREWYRYHNEGPEPVPAIHEELKKK